MRRDQFNLTVGTYSDEVYQFIEKLSSSRKLSEWVKRAVEMELGRQGTAQGFNNSTQLEPVMQQLLEIKSLILQRDCTARAEPQLAPSTPIIEQISNDSVHQILSDDEINYNF